MKKRVVITGYGLVTPLGCSAENVWRRICQGESGIRNATEEEFQTLPTTVAGFCDDFSIDGYINPREVKKLDRFAQFAVAAAVDAVQLSGIDFCQEDKSRCAVIVGSGVGGLGEVERQYLRLLERGPNKVSAFTITRFMPNSASGYISILYGLNGPSCCIATACASANNAMIDAAKLIQYDEADLVITGGAEAAMSKLGVAGFSAMHALSQRNSDPKGASRPFDADRDGFVLSEGGGILVFEELEHAKRRKANIYAEVLGFGSTSDATHITQPDARGINAGRAMALTLQSAGLRTNQVDYVNAHGTATKLGDTAETNAIKYVFGDVAKKLSISSTKSQIGHLLGGSGGVELIFSLLALRDGIIPPTINLENPDIECDLDYTPNVAKEKKMKTAISNSFGFGGHNACIAIRRFDE